MKIAIDVSQVVFEGTGVANYTRDLIFNLLVKDRRNQFILFGYSLRRKKILDSFLKSIPRENGRIKCISLPVPPSLADLIWNRFGILSLEHLIGPVDIYHSSDWIQIPSPAKNITTVHDLVVYKYPETSSPSIIAVQKRRLARVIKHCRLILSDSMATKKDIIDILQVNENRISVVYPGISPIFKPVPEEKIKKVSKKYNINYPYILSVGTNEPRKNITSSVDAFNIFLKNLPPRETKEKPALIIVGKKGWKSNFSSHTPEIINLGSVDRQDLPSLYGGARFLVYPSLYEGFGLPVVEAMACGCPVITSNKGSLAEVAGQAALIVDPQKPEDLAIAMINLETDNTLRKKLIAAGLINCRRFSWSTAVEKVLLAYNSLIKK